MRQYTEVKPPFPCTSTRIKCDACGIKLLGQQMRNCKDGDLDNFHCMACASQIENQLNGHSAPTQNYAPQAQNINIDTAGIISAIDKLADALQAKPAAHDKPVALFSRDERVLQDFAHDITALKTDYKNLQAQVLKLQAENAAQGEHIANLKKACGDLSYDLTMLQGIPG